MTPTPRLIRLLREGSRLLDELADELEADRDLKPEKPSQPKRRRVYPPRPAKPEQVDEVSRQRARRALGRKGR